MEVANEGCREHARFHIVVASCVIALPSFAAFLKAITGHAIDSGVVNMAGLPSDLAGGGLLAQPLAAYAAMGFSRRLCSLHTSALCLAPRQVVDS